MKLIITLSKGVFVRYGPNKLSINHPSALKKIYGHKANIRKSDFYLAFPAAPGVFSTHTAIDRHAHARKRRVMSHAFSDAALKGLENLVLVHIRSFIYRLGGRDSNASLCNPRGSPDPARKEWTEPRNLSAWSSYLAFDVMGDLCFGKSFGMLGDKPENREAVFLLAQAARRHNIVRNFEVVLPHRDQL